MVTAHAAAALPAFMVPADVVALEQMPLGATGKLDRRALPEPEIRFAATVPARTESEVTVAGIFADLLGHPEVGASDDFFALGGNSLTATRVIARINAAFDTGLGVRALFEAPNVAALANLAAAQRGSGGLPPLVAGARPQRVPLSPAQTRMWFLNRFDPDSVTYTIPVVVRLSGELDVAALRAAVGDLLVRHESLRTVYPDDGDGPVQVILAPDSVALDLDPVTATAEDLPARIAGVLGRGFDVTTSVPIRVALFALDPGEHVLVLAVHHISGDGFSTGPLARDVLTAYTRAPRRDRTRVDTTGGAVRRLRPVAAHGARRRGRPGIRGRAGTRLLAWTTRRTR